MLMPPPAPEDPRWSAELAGGGIMDVGCYALRAVRDLAALRGGEPRVLRAAGGEHPDHPGVDAWMSADLELPGGVPARVESSMTHHDVDFSLRLVGSRGEAYAPNFVKPQQDDRVVVTRVGAEPVVEHLGTRSSYSHMLEAFVRLVREGVPMRSGADDAVASMTLVDAVYRAAGMQPRRGAGPLHDRGPGGPPADDEHDDVVCQVVRGTLEAEVVLRPTTSSPSSTSTRCSWATRWSARCGTRTRCWTCRPTGWPAAERRPAGRPGAGGRAGCPGHLRGGEQRRQPVGPPPARARRAPHQGRRAAGFFWPRKRYAEGERAAYGALLREALTAG